MKLKVLSPIDHDGKRYEIGKPLDVKDEDQAQALIDAGAAEEDRGESAAEKKEREKQEADAKKAEDDAAAEAKKKADADKKEADKK